MFEALKGLIERFIMQPFPAFDDRSMARAVVVPAAARFGAARSPRPHLTCRWVHDPAQNKLVCVWIADEMAQDHRFAAAA